MMMMMMMMKLHGLVSHAIYMNISLISRSKCLNQINISLSQARVWYIPGTYQVQQQLIPESEDNGSADTSPCRSRSMLILSFAVSS